MKLKIYQQNKKTKKKNKKFPNMRTKIATT